MTKEFWFLKDNVWKLISAKVKTAQYAQETVTLEQKYVPYVKTAMD